MHIQVNTDHTIEGHDALAAHIRGVVENALSRMSEHITRVIWHTTRSQLALNRQGSHADERVCG